MKIVLTVLSVLLIVLLIVLVSCSSKNLPLYRATSQPVDEQIENLLSRMTLEEKIGMIHANSKFTVSGVERLGIPEWVMLDGPHGVREEISRDSWDPAGWTSDSASYIGTGTELAATWNPELARKFGQVLGAEARWRKKDVILGPGVNIMRTPLNGRNFEYQGEDPFLASKMVVPLVQGIQENDVAACVKHYTANSQEYERFKINELISERALREIYLPAFKAAVQEGEALTVMTAYNKVNGTYCSEHDHLQNDILKKEWGFPGAIISDWDGTHSTIGAALGGLDVEMGTKESDYDDYYFADALLEAVKNGKVDEGVVDDKVRRILRVMFKTKIFDSDRAAGAFTTPLHSMVSKRIASEAIVLLKNKNKFLPFSTEQFKSITVIGDNASRKHAKSGGSSAVKAKYEISPLEGLRNKLGDAVQLNVAQGYEKTTTFSWDKPLRNDFDPERAKQLREQAVAVAKRSDAAIIFGGLNHDFDSEGWDRPDMKLPYEQDLLIQQVLAANPNTVVVLIGGSPMDVRGWIDDVPAVLLGWYAGMEAGNAMADVLFGDVNPSGKLPFTFPKKLEDSPAHAMGNYPGTDLTVKHEEGIFVGYRWFDTKNIKPQFAFGYGLSYTTFEFSDLRLDKRKMKSGETLSVSVDVKNTGSHAGAEVVQLYISDVQASVERPLKELKGYKKVFLKAGEEKTVNLSLDIDALSFYDEITAGWKAEKGKFEILIGSSAKDIHLRDTFALVD